MDKNYISIHDRKEDCFNCQFCHYSEDETKCSCLVQSAGKPKAQEQVNNYLSGRSERCPVMVKIKW